MYLDKNIDKRWLLKSENKILGPYSFDEVLDLLRKRQISIIDEIRDPETRWLYVRENPEFKDVVEEIRKEIDSRQESTKTHQTASVTSTVTTTANLADTNASYNTTRTEVDDLIQKTKTDIPAQFDRKMPDPKDIEVVNEIVLTRSARPNTVVEKAKIYGVQTDSAVQQRMNSFANRLRWAAAALVVFVLCGYGGYYYYQQKNAVKKEEQLVLRVKALKYLGLNDQAAQLYYKLPPNLQKTMLPELLDIFPALQKEGSISFEQISGLATAGQLTVDQRAVIPLIQFWLAVKEQNYGQAQEFIVQARTQAPSYSLIVENDAWLSLKRDNAKDAFKTFTSLYNKNKEPRHLLGKALSLTADSNIEERSRSARSVLSEIDSYTILSYYLRKELLLLQIYLAQDLQDEEGRNIYRYSLAQYLNTPPQLSQSYTKPELLMPDVYSWKELERVKSSVMTRLNGDDLIMFELHDLLEQGRLNEAAQFVTNQQIKLSQPHLKFEMNILLRHMQGRSEEVVNIAKMSPAEQQTVLSHFIIAYNKVKTDPNQDVSVHTDFIENEQKNSFLTDWLRLEALLSKNNVAEIRQFLKTHFETINNFIPVITARHLVNNE